MAAWERLVKLMLHDSQEAVVDAACGVLRRERLRRGMSMSTVGELAGISTHENGTCSALYAWESGRRRPTLLNFLRWCGGLNVKPAETLRKAQEEVDA